MFRVSRVRANKKNPKGEDIQTVVWLGASQRMGYRQFDDASKHVDPGEIVELMQLVSNSASAPPGTKTWHVIAAYGGRRAGRPEGMYYDNRAKRSGNSLGGFGDHSRARKIVSLAATRTEDPNTSDWLRTDREGTWEKTAAEYLEKTREKAAALGLAEEQVNDEIASRLAYEALTAQVAHLKKKRTRK